MNILRLLPFLLVVLVLSGTLHFYLGSRLLLPLALEGGTLDLAIGLVVLSALVIPGTMLLLPASGRPWADRLQAAGYLFMGFFSLVLVGLGTVDLLWLVVRALGALVPGLWVFPLEPDILRAWQLGLNGTVVAISLLLGTAAAFQARKEAGLVLVPIPLPQLHEDLRGFRIAQISDLHIGPTVRRGRVQAIVDRVNALEPDLVAITGDLVDGGVDQLAPHVAPIGELRAKHGTWFVTGNHEYYSGADAWCRHIATLGVDVLIDEHRLLNHGDATILIAGVADLHAARFIPSHRSDPVRAVEGAPASDFRLLLAHQPDSANAARGLGFQLQLSGHTHGGQYFPFNLLIHFVQRFVGGLYRFDESWVYVSRGTTFWGPPMRLGTRQEITLLELCGS